MFKQLHQEYYLKGENLLCHYTKGESLLKILSSMQLKFSKFENLNDLNETEVNFQVTDFNLSATLLSQIIDKCRLISFTKDTFDEESGLIDEWALNHPRMWAQYADDNKGACLVLDEKKLIQQNLDLLNLEIFKIEDVDYDMWTMADEEVNSKTFEEVIQDRYKLMFFKKSKDWLGERERRILQFGNKEFINIDGCILYVCLGFRFNQYGELINLISNKFESKKQILIPHDFAIQVDSYGSINALDGSHKIMEHLEQNSSYYKYLFKNGY